MRAAISGAVFHALIFMVLCGALVAAFKILPDMNIKWYPNIVVSLISFSPMMYSQITAKRLFATVQRPLAWREYIAFAVSVLALVGVVAAVCEAAILYLTYGQPSGLSFAEILMAPLSERYALVGSSGFSFAVTSLFAAGLAGVIFVPARMRVLGANPAV